ncbi:uncharacterized protein EKO05_0005652 [Ascochyta rabiei]|uniref:DNA binding n=1 Tax=Didymella rabiei TaxID=5454 RepID=A0A163FG56_DIDRA|nr:uncharacterized protein EKO05_0005652 [Ascochyta rabiei]KZM24340.1 DNA binding [Ascochyta rabiei]UPX15195.1 hypothetical protein EKO05_0005652 [Ascochyta rabiei]
MDIRSILNSPCGDSRNYRHPASSPLVSAQCRLAPVAIAKREKIAKDAPVFSESNKVVGYVNYPPHEAGSDCDLAARHRQFCVFPLGQIHKKGVRHIPYNSDKKDFLEKTGREAFEVFQYTFKRPGEDKEYVVVWDYNVGLVRMTPFFKSCKYSKTVPAKALRENPGMKDISYSITGGALVCQGYWMPYQAAREIAATFCWDIRWALTPVFGNDFPQICWPPEHPRFSKFAIDPRIVSFCTEETARFRKEGAAYQFLQLQAPSPVMTPLLPPVLSSPIWKHAGRPGDLESGYGSDVERNDNLTLSVAQVSPRSQFSRFTPINEAERPRSPHTAYPSGLSSPFGEHAQLTPVRPTSNPDGYYNKSFRTKRTHSKFSSSVSGCGVEQVGSPTMHAVNSAKGVGESRSEQDRRYLEAAEALIMLSRGGAVVLPEPKRTRPDSRH